MGITINNYGTWNQYSEIKEVIEQCVKEDSVTKKDVDDLLDVLRDINTSQNDLTTEFAKMSVDWEASRKTGMLKKLNDRVTLTNGMVTLGKTALGIVTKNPSLALPGVIEMAKDMVE